MPARLRVVHLHRLGSCTGELIVTREGLSFVPDDDGSRKDAFTLKHHEYLPVLEDGDLTIRSSDRVYRFKAADAPGSAARLAGLAHSLTSLRSVP